MTKFRTHLPLLVCATALALSTATTSAASFSELQGISTEIKTIDLPSPPKPAAPGMTSGPQVPTIRKEMDVSTPLLQPALPAAKLKMSKGK